MAYEDPNDPQQAIPPNQMTPVKSKRPGQDPYDWTQGRGTNEGVSYLTGDSPVDDWTNAATGTTPPYNAEDNPYKNDFSPRNPDGSLTTSGWSGPDGSSGGAAPSTTAPAAPQYDYRNSNDLRSQLNEWAGAVPYSDPSVTDGSYDWLGAINEKGGLNADNMDYWKSRVQSDPNDYTGQNPNNWYRNEDASRAAGNAPMTDPRNLTSMAQTTQTAGAQWGPPPQPDWVPIAGGGWVPPSHPEAVNAVGPPGVAPTTPAPTTPTPETAPSNGSPGPGWVQIEGGGWVPPDHPLAQTPAPVVAPAPVDPGPAIPVPTEPENPEGPRGPGGEPLPPVVPGGPEEPPPGEAAPVTPGEPAPPPPATVDSTTQQMLDMLVSRMSQSEDVDPNDPSIRNRTDMFQSRQDRARQGFLREQAEASGPYGNLNSERRNSAEQVGQNTSAFEQTLIDQELTARRAEIQNAMAQTQSYATEQQRQAMQKELADLDRALAQSQMAQQNSQFGRSLDESKRQSDASRTESGRQFDLSTAEGRRQFDTAEAERSRQFNVGEEGQNSRFNRQMNDAMEQYLKSIGQRAYEFDTENANQVLG